MDFEELTIIYDSANYLVHIVRFVRVIRNDVVQGIFQTVDRVCAVYIRSFFQIVLWNVAQQFADKSQAFFFCLCSKMSNTRFGGVNARATQVFLAYVFSGYSLYYLRTGKEHVGCTFHHQSKVCQGRRVNGATGTRTENTGNLRNDTRSKYVTLEDFSVASQGINTFLNTCTARVVDTDTRSTHFHGLVHNLTDFQRHGFGQ